QCTTHRTGVTVQDTKSELVCCERKIRQGPPEKNFRQPEGALRTGRAAPPRSRLGASRAGTSPQSISASAKSARRSAPDRERTSTQDGQRSAFRGKRKIAQRRSAAQLLRNPQPDRRRSDR